MEFSNVDKAVFLFVRYKLQLQTMSLFFYFLVWLFEILVKLFELVCPFFLLFEYFAVIFVLIAHLGSIFSKLHQLAIFFFDVAF